MSPLLQNQLAELTNQKQQQVASGGDKKRRKLVVVSQNCIEPLQALRDGSKEVLLFLQLSPIPPISNHLLSLTLMTQWFQILNYCLHFYLFWINVSTSVGMIMSLY